MELLRYKEIDYAVEYPRDFSEEGSYPLVIYLPGAGSRGRNTSLITGHGFFSETAPFLRDALRVMPQCYADSWFDIFEQLQDFVASVIARPEVDKARVYLCGASMGGYGTWQLAMSRPEWFAAILPICGGGMYWNASRLSKMGVWAFHGDDDPTVLCVESEKMVNAVNAFGGSARLTVYPNCQHNAWTPTFRDPAVWKWLLSQKNQNAAIARSAYDDVVQFG